MLLESCMGMGVLFRKSEIKVFEKFYYYYGTFDIPFIIDSILRETIFKGLFSSSSSAAAEISTPFVGDLLLVKCY